MMKIGGVSETNNIQVSQIRSYSTTNAAITDIKKKISDANQQLRELSLDKDMAIEEKTKKRQELQKEISILYQKLRQYQIEQRKEQQSIILRGE